jgi:hypothetical protein
MTAATVAAPSGSQNFGFKQHGVGLTAFTLSHAWLTAETDETNDTVEFGYLPSGITVIGLLNYVGDLDSGTALRHTIKLGSTSLVTADDLASAGGGEAHFFAPIVLTVPTLVSVVTTTGATGHQNGTQHLTFLYHSTST